MTLIALPVYVPSAAACDHALQRVAGAADAGARLVEWRVDQLAGDEHAGRIVADLVAGSPLPCVITCRPAWEGGQFDGDDAERLALFENLLTRDHRPRYIDVELRSWTQQPSWRERLTAALEQANRSGDLKTGLILSAHDFAGRPRDLIQRVETMTNEPACDVIKIAWMARSLRDNLEAFDHLLERRKPMIALCMGRFGLMSRVLAPKFRGLLTFATDSPERETAPGQPTIRALRERYRFDEIDSRTKVYGVIGWPVEHSLGPVIHNAGFRAIGHDGVYLPMPIPQEYEHFKATLGAMIDHHRLHFRGASVTIPHKEHLLRFVVEHGGRTDVLTERIGAANTLRVSSTGALECANTDAPAIVDALAGAGVGVAHTRGSDPGHERDDAEVTFDGLTVALLGAGGVARAAAAALSERGAKVVIFNRTHEHAEHLAGQLHGRGIGEARQTHVVAGRTDRLACGCFDVFINCTPIGMAGGPAPEASPLTTLAGRDVPLDESEVVFDTVYTPQRTPLIAEAESRGARVVTGMDLFLRQAARQFEMWTDHPAPEAAFRAAIEAHTSAS